jgi:hypothetical protein
LRPPRYIQQCRRHSIHLFKHYSKPLTFRQGLAIIAYLSILAENAADQALEKTERALLARAEPLTPDQAKAWLRICFWGGTTKSGLYITGTLEARRKKHQKSHAFSLSESFTEGDDGEIALDRVADPAHGFLQGELERAAAAWMAQQSFLPAEREVLWQRLVYDRDWRALSEETRMCGSEANLRRWGLRQIQKLRSELRESWPDLDPAYSPETGSFSFLSYFLSKSSERVWPRPVVVLAPVPQNAARVARVAAARRASSGAPRRQVRSIQPINPTQVRCLLGQAIVLSSKALMSGGACESSSSVGAGILSGAKRSQLRRQLARKRSGSGRGSSSSWETKAVGVANSSRRRSGTGT